MDEPAREVPEDLGIPRPWWRQQRRLLPLVLAVLLVLSAVAALAVTRLRSGPAEKKAAVSGKPPSSMETPTVGSSAEDSTSVGATPSAEASAAPGPRGWVVYRLGDRLWVARDDGTGPRDVARSDEGPLSLSPDGLTIALVDTASQTLMLIDVATGESKAIESAQGIRPSWSPTSDWVAYTAGSPGSGVVRTASREGSVTITVSAGHDPRASADGRTVGFIAGGTASQPGPLMVAQLGAAPSPVDSVEAVGVAFTPSALIYSTDSTPGAGSSVWVSSLDGDSPRQLVAPRIGDPPAVYSSLLPSPSGDRLLFAAVGDDGFSRMFSVPTSGGTPVALSPRFDGYPIGWSADGTRILFIEGNAFQGEPTSLMSVRPDGTQRRTLVRGASR